MARHSAGSGFKRADGLSSTARGYGADWRRARLAHLAIEPLCRFCTEAGRVTGATDVDHIEAFNGLDDPLRLDDNNLRSLCGPCHMSRTARQSNGTDDPGVCASRSRSGSAVDGGPSDPSHPWYVA